MKKYLGLDIGGTKCAAVVGDENGQVLDKIRFATTEKDETLRHLNEAAQALGASECAGIGVSCGGPLDSTKGLILSPPNLPGWDDVPIASLLRERFGVPARLCNDANACALAEWRFGAGQGTKNMIFLTFGTGMGAGLILDGKLYAGTNDMAGEVGHLRLTENGPVGYGKIGSVEGFCSGGGLAQLGALYARRAIQVGKPAAYCPTLDALPTVTARSIAEAACGGDETACEVYRACGEKLGSALSILVDLLNPEKIVIGSIFARSQNLLWESAQRVLTEEALPLSAGVCSVIPAALGERIGDVAALCVAMAAENA